MLSPLLKKNEISFEMLQPRKIRREKWEFVENVKVSSNPNNSEILFYNFNTGCYFMTLSYKH